MLLQNFPNADHRNCAKHVYKNLEALFKRRKKSAVTPSHKVYPSQSSTAAASSSAPQPSRDQQARQVCGYEGEVEIGGSRGGGGGVEVGGSQRGQRKVGGVALHRGGGLRGRGGQRDGGEVGGTCSQRERGQVGDFRRGSASQRGGEEVGGGGSQRRRGYGCSQGGREDSDCQGMRDLI